MRIKRVVLGVVFASFMFSCSDDIASLSLEDGIHNITGDSVSSGTTVEKSENSSEEVSAEVPMMSDESDGDYSVDPVDGEGTIIEEVAPLQENDFIKTSDSTQSTFSIDVDHASYTYTKQQVQYGTIPSANSIRIEEFINYFEYAYTLPKGDNAFNIITMVGDCPWNSNNKLAHIGLQGKAGDILTMPSNNLVFLIDVSGSMGDQIEMLKNSFAKMMAENFNENDYVSIVTYAGHTEVALESTPCSDANKIKIIDVLEGLQASGSTAGGAGIVLAYEQAAKNFISDGNNRVILATDGDFNVGVSSDTELVTLIEEQRETGVYLSALGFGMSGTYGDAKMEKITNSGNGNYFYINNEVESDRVLGRDLFSNIQTIAKDVKIQIEFNASRVAEYRLIGYENRVLSNNDFANDAVDAGEIGPGHSVTALYELVMKDTETEGTIFDVNLRYKDPDATESKLIVEKVDSYEIGDLATDFNFSAAVAEFAMLLKGSKYKGTASYTAIKALATENLGTDTYGLRAEFLSFVDNASRIIVVEPIEDPVVDPILDPVPTPMPIIEE